MLNVQNYKIFKKLMWIVAIMALLILAVGLAGIRALGAMEGIAAQIERTSKEIIGAQELGREVLMLDRAGLHLAMDPGQEHVRDARKHIAAGQKTLEEHLGQLAQGADDMQKKRVEQIQALYQDYLKRMNTNLDVAATVRDPESLAEQERLNRAAADSMESADRLRDAIDEYDGHARQKLDEVSQIAMLTRQHATTIIVTCALLGILIGSVLGYLIAEQGIARPLRSMVAALQRLAKGDYAATIPCTEFRDEIGDIARAAIVFRENGQEKERLQAQEKMQGHQEMDAKRASVHEMADAFEHTIGSVVKALGNAAAQLKQSAQHMAMLADKTGKQSTVVAAASEQAATSVTSVASASEQLTASIGEIGRQMAATSEKTGYAVKEANITNQTIGELSESAHKIGQVINMINAIADQTNLLALNATIEAARAGDAGKGFAVVASEVKALAQQTAQATDEISAQIHTIKSMTEGSVERIRNISATINEINQGATIVASAVEEQNSVTRDISRSINEAAGGTTEVSRNILGITQAVTEAETAAAEVLRAAEVLSGHSEMLDCEVHRFLDTIRKAA